MATLTPKNFDAEPFVDNSEWSNLRGQSAIDTDGGRTLDDSDLTSVDDHSTSGRDDRTDGSSDSTDNPYTDENGSQTDSDSTKDTSSAIDALNEYLNNLGGQITDWKTFYDLMNKIYSLTGADDFVSGSDARLAITEKIADMVYNFTLTLYSNAYQSQMWYEQQEYNSPAQQLKRLADAGLAGMFSSISSNTAQSAASSSDTAANTSSGAAQIQQQAKQNRIQNALSGLGLVMDLASLGVSGFQAATELGVKQAQSLLMTTQASQLSQMTPHQVRNVMLDNYCKQGQARLFAAEESLKEANIPFLEAQTFAQYASAFYAGEELKQSFTNMLLNAELGFQNLDLTRELGFAGLETNLATAKISAGASMYAADKSAEASKFSSIMSAGSGFTMLEETIGYQKVNSQGEVYGEILFGTDLGFTDANTKVGGTYKKGNETYKAVRVQRNVPISPFIKEQLGIIDDITRNPSQTKFVTMANLLTNHKKASSSLAKSMANWWKQAFETFANYGATQSPFKDTMPKVNGGLPPIDYSK